ncbi:hypothetical protein D3C72_2061290 [compost metagenome]
MESESVARARHHDVLLAWSDVVAANFPCEAVAAETANPEGSFAQCGLKAQQLVENRERVLEPQDRAVTGPALKPMDF